ncbi:hypothetical protein [Niveispirillum cyanobacteriorum]|uniref:hypothetical protein n=1 Tax=Niveispirillum cyanobacteriorum TaxID=1612173 RepID=UPI00131A0160|nr:hypothetical protein [Niveispirillum cyanobacteriorum]GGE45548.1 hypothetical protein GCM10011317_00050 [Niveispirillum cyanobacteriorum]
MPDVPSPVVAKQIDVTYLTDEDRLLLTVRGSEGSCAFWLTRRLCSGLLKGLADILTRTSSLLSRAPSDSRTQILMFEHAEALLRQNAAGAPGEAPALRAPVEPSPNNTVHLVQIIDLSAKGDTIRFSLLAGGICYAVLPLSRDNAHQLAGMLFNKAQHAGWALDDCAWIDCRSQVILPVGTSPN